MAGYTGEKRWRNNMNPEAPNSGVSELARDVCVKMLDALTDAEAAYAELLELYVFSGSTIQGLADQLFIEDIESRLTPGTNAVLTVDVAATPAQIDFGTTAGGVVDSVAIVDGGAGYYTGGTFNITVASDGGFVAGTEATITYTVSGGAINSVVVTEGGSGYTADLAATTDVAAADLPVPAGGRITGATIDTAGTGYNDGNYRLDSVAVNGQNGGGALAYTVSGGAITAVSVVASGSGYENGTGQTVSNFPLAGSVSDTQANADELAKAQAAFDAITALHELYLAADNQTVAAEDRLAQLRRMT